MKVDIGNDVKEGNSTTGNEYLRSEIPDKRKEILKRGNLIRRGRRRSCHDLLVVQEIGGHAKNNANEASHKFVGLGPRRPPPSRLSSSRVCDLVKVHSPKLQWLDIFPGTTSAWFTSPVVLLLAASATIWRDETTRPVQLDSTHREISTRLFHF